MLTFTPRRRRFARLQQVQIAGLFEDQAVLAVVDVEDGEVLELGDGLHVVGRRLRTVRLEREDVVLAGPVGPEVDRVAQPVRVEVVAPVLRLRDFDDLVRGHVVHPNAAVGAAAVVLPLRRGVPDRRVRDVLAVRRIARLEPPRDRQLRRHPAGQRHREQLAVPGREDVAVRREQDRIALRREPADHVRAGVVRQPGGRAAVHRQGVHVGVAVVLGAEREERAVRREDRVRLDAEVGGQPLGVLAVEVGGPQVFAVDERDLLRADGRHRQQPRVVGRPSSQALPRAAASRRV